MPTNTPVAVVGGGQAGLATSYWLQRHDIDHVVFERGRSGDSWRRRWDTFCLVSPNWSLNLPGYPYDGPDPDGFMPRDEIVDYVEGYRRLVSPPMESPVEVQAVRRKDDRWRLDTSSGQWEADDVVVAGGSFQTPSLPGSAAEVTDDIRQIHSSEYESPEQLPPGAVLVVGSGQSGCQITDDLREAGRDVWLAVGSATRMPRTYRGRDVFSWLRDTGFLDNPMTQHPQGPEARYAANPQASGRDGGKEIDLRRFGREGVELLGRFRGASGHQLRFATDVIERLDAADEACRQMTQGLDQHIADTGIDAPPDDREQIDWEPSRIRESIDPRAEGIVSIVWCTGFDRDYTWIEGLETDSHGYPLEERGVTGLPGVYFVGLHGMYSLGSGLFWGVGADAEHVVGHLA